MSFWIVALAVCCGNILSSMVSLVINVLWQLRRSTKYVYVPLSSTGGSPTGGSSHGTDDYLS